MSLPADNLALVPIDIDEWGEDIDDTGHACAHCPICAFAAEIEYDDRTCSYRWVCACGAVSFWS